MEIRPVFPIKEDTGWDSSEMSVWSLGSSVVAYDLLNVYKTKTGHLKFAAGIISVLHRWNVEDMMVQAFSAQVTLPGRTLVPGPNLLRTRPLHYGGQCSAFSCRHSELAAGCDGPLSPVGRLGSGFRPLCSSRTGEGKGL